MEIQKEGVKLTMANVRIFLINVGAIFLTRQGILFQTCDGIRRNVSRKQAIYDPADDGAWKDFDNKNP